MQLDQTDVDESLRCNLRLRLMILCYYLFESNPVAPRAALQGVDMEEG